MFGFPTGVGCLLARRDALARLRRPWFSGGTITAASVGGGWHRLAPGEAAFEDGTVNFLSIPDVTVGLDWLGKVGMDLIGYRTSMLTSWLIDGLCRLRHSSGGPLVRIYGPLDMESRGATVALNFLTPDGRLVDERAVTRDASAAGISLRTGCFCNPGVGEAAFGLRDGDLARAGRALAASDCLDAYLSSVGMATGGAVRVSLGVASTLEDVERFLDFAERTYRDQAPELSGLAPRPNR
jgi:selenocysteine lyase/cysteine desulfurase